MQLCTETFFLEIGKNQKYEIGGRLTRSLYPNECRLAFFESNNEDDVRLQWERIKLSYEILSNKKMRTRYERNLSISDPKAAMQRAAMDAAGGAAVGVASYVGKGIFAVGKGLFSMGAKAVSDSVNNNKKEEKKDDVAQAQVF